MPTNLAAKDGPPATDVDVSNIPDAVPTVEAQSKYGNPPYYVIAGRKHYVLSSAKGYNKVGLASWYGTKFHGRLTSSREPYNMYAMTAASLDLPIPSYVRVTNLKNGKSVLVKVNDRGPFASDRIIDLSYAAAKKLGYFNTGTARVRVTAIDPVLWAQQQQAGRKTLYAANQNNLYLQVGAFKQRTSAEHLQKRVIALTGANVLIRAAQKQQQTIYRVQVGPLPTNETEALKQKILANGLSDTVHIIS